MGIAILVTLFINFGVQHSNRNSSTGSNELAVVVIDRDDSEESRQVLNSFKANQEVLVLESLNHDTALKELFRQKIEAIFILEKGFGEELVKGKSKDLITLQYAKGNITAEMIGEILGREAFRVYSAERVIRDINKQYRKVDKEFTDQMRQEAIEYNESFWDEGMTIEMDISYIEGTKATNEEAGNLFKNIVIHVLVCMIVLILIFAFANELIVQRRVGIIDQLKVQGVGYGQYAAIYILAKVFWVAIIFSVISLVIGVISGKEIASYLGLIGGATIITIGLGRLPSSKLLFSLMPLLGITIAIIQGYLRL